MTSDADAPRARPHEQDETPDEVAAEAAGDAPAEGEETAAGGPDAPAQDRVEALESQLAAARAEVDETEQRLRRAQADFANYRKRMMAEQGRWKRQAVARFARAILPVVDNLERALAAARDDADAKAFREGVELTLRQFREALAAQEIQAIEAEGKPFDPRYHEAVAQVESRQVPEEHVVDEVQRGYLQGSEVLRPSLVQVARRPAAADAEDSADEDVHGSDEEGRADGEGCGD